MRDDRMVRVSKRLSLHLRHTPERIGIELGDGGWVEVDTAAGHVFHVSANGVWLTDTVPPGYLRIPT